MPSAPSLLRAFLIFVLCTEGMLGAWASTRMAVNAVAHAAAADGQTAGEAASEDCEEGDTPGAARQDGQAAHHDCDCNGQAACACNCMFAFYPHGGGVLFAAQHRLASVYSGALPEHHPQAAVSRVFRPPIG